VAPERNGWLLSGMGGYREGWVAAESDGWLLRGMDGY
jgi:hypothetical protein